MKESIDFIEGDAFDVIESGGVSEETVFFIDPPYSVGGKGKSAGRRLYSCFEVDHERLFDIVSKIEGDFLMTYDNADEVKELAGKFGLDTELVAMKNTHHAEMKELLIGKNLDWARHTIPPFSRP
jgi:DNA adenine methylase